jgi:malate dehydrogenase (oxaloacetate-decarboxylating)(NADP+)
MMCRRGTDRFRTHLAHVQRRHRPARGRAKNDGGAEPAGHADPRVCSSADTYVNADPDPETLAEITLLAADEVLRFGIQPKVALLSHSNFGSSERCLGAGRWRQPAVKILHERDRRHWRSTARCMAMPR